MPFLIRNQLNHSSFSFYKNGLCVDEIWYNQPPKFIFLWIKIDGIKV